MESVFLNRTKRSNIQFFLIKLGTLFIIVYSLDFVIGGMLNYLYFRQKSGILYRSTYSMENTEADLLVFGSSRANHHYEPTAFENRLHLSFYNLGRDGNYILYHYAVLKSVLKRYKPKVIILDITRGEFNKEKDSYDRLSSILPYYRSHPEIRSIIELRSPYEKIKLLSGIYPYNSSILTIAIGNTDYNNNLEKENLGYIPLEKVSDNSIVTDSENWTEELDIVKVKIFESFIKDCINSNVKLYLVCSPYFLKFTKNDESIFIAEKIALEYKLKFYDFSNNSIYFKSSKLFANRDHLNDQGAKVFSNMLIDSISNLSGVEPPKGLLRIKN